MLPVRHLAGLLHADIAQRGLLHRARIELLLHHLLLRLLVVLLLLVMLLVVKLLVIERTRLALRHFGVVLRLQKEVALALLKGRRRQGRLL